MKIPVRITSRHLTLNFPIARNISNLHNLIPIKRQETIFSHSSPSSIRSLPNVMVLNARSIFNKVDELKVHIENYKSDIVFITETWLSESIPNEAIHIDGFNVFRKDRTEMRGGGVAIYIKDDVPVKIRSDLNDKCVECLWVTLRPKWLPRKISRIALACVYLPPSISPNDLEVFYVYFQSCYDILSTESCDTAFIVAGDFNPSSNGFKQRVLNIHCNFKQIVKEATRNTNILDLIFTNVCQYYEVPEVIAPLSSADHNMVTWTSKMQQPQNNTTRKVTVRPIKPSALELFRLFLGSYNWNDVISASTVDDKLEKFLTTTNKMINEFFPTKTVRFHNNDKFFMTAKLKKMIYARNCAYKQGKSDRFRFLRNRVKYEISSAKEKYYKDNISGNCDKDSSKWWKRINKLTGKNKSSNILLSDPESHSAMNDKDTANYINSFFAGLTKDFPVVNDKWLAHDETESLPTVSTESVSNKLRKLKTNKAPGLNDPNVKILKTFADFFATPLADIFNESFKSKRFPTIWKDFWVSSIPKCIPCTSVDELRPIALISAISKLQESYVVNWLNEDIDGKITEAQYGGQSGSSAVLALTYLVHKWHMALDSPGFVIRITFLDFRKAYDLIDHNILLKNCWKIGIRPALITWLASYLSGRTQVTKYGSEVSDRLEVHGGVPQGSRIGPVAFIVHINGLPLVLKESERTYNDDVPKGNEDEDDVTIFMDDTTISEIIDIKNHIPGNTIGNAERNMTEVMNFTKQQKMELNLKKCKEMLIDLRRNKTAVPLTKIGNNIIERVTSYKLLGLWIDNNMKWNTNTDKIIKKAAKRLFLLKVLKSYGASSSDMKVFYIAVIRPTLEYGAQVWNGGITKEQSKEIERIQKRALRVIYKEDDYDKALRIANIESLEKRRDRMCIELIKKMANSDHRLHNLLPMKVHEIRNRETRLNNQMYYNFMGKTDRFKNSPISYAINKYNESLSG